MASHLSGTMPLYQPKTERFYLYYRDEQHIRYISLQVLSAINDN